MIFHDEQLPLMTIFVRCQILNCCLPNDFLTRSIKNDKSFLGIQVEILKWNRGLYPTFTRVLFMGGGVKFTLRKSQNWGIMPVYCSNAPFANWKQSFKFEKLESRYMLSLAVGMISELHNTIKVVLFFSYRTRTIITHGLYTFYPLFEVQKRFFKGHFS